MLIAFCLSGCAKIDFIDGGKKITSKHLSIAVLPPIVNIKQCSYLKNDNCLRANNLETLALYQSLFRFILHKNSQNRYRLKIIDKDVTLDSLIKANINTKHFSDYNKICDLLGVDVVLVSNFDVSQPTSPEASAALALVTDLAGFGFSSTTNHIKGDVFLFDNKTSQKIWTYEHSQRGSFLQAKKGVHNKLMLNIANNLPYY